MPDVISDAAAVESVRRGDGQILVKAPAGHTAEITRALVEAGVSVTGLQRRERQLEDVFLDLTTHPTDSLEVSHA